MIALHEFKLTSECPRYLVPIVRPFDWCIPPFDLWKAEEGQSGVGFWFPATLYAPTGRLFPSFYID